MFKYKLCSLYKKGQYFYHFYLFIDNITLSPSPRLYSIQLIAEKPKNSNEIFLTDDVMKLILEVRNKEIKIVSEEKNINNTPVSAEVLGAYNGKQFIALFAIFSALFRL